MPQLILAVLAIALVLLAVAIVVWIVQWLVAGIVWLFQAVLLPSVVFLLPALIIVVVFCGLCWGGWIAARNYFETVRTRVRPEGALETLVRNSVVSTQTLTLALLCAAAAWIAALLFYQAASSAVEYIHGYYAAIEFPIFNIVFPFWEQ